MGRRTLIAAGMVVALVVAGAVVADRMGDETSERQSTGVGAAQDSAGSSVSGPVSPSLPTPELALRPDAGKIAPVPPGSGTIDPANPKIVRTADLSVEVDKGRFGDSFDRVAAIAASHGGYVTSSTTYTSRDGKRADSGQLTVRVPSDRFEDARNALRQLGTVEQEALRGEDVSGQLVDYEARLRSLQAQEESLRALLGKAANVGEVLQVQTSLFEVRQQIEQLQAQRTQLDQAASLATIQVSLYEPGAQIVPDPDPEPATGLANAFERAKDGAVAVVGGMIVVLGWLTPLAVIGLIGWGALRLRRRSGRTRGVVGPASAPPATT